MLTFIIFSAFGLFASNEAAAYGYGNSVNIYDSYGRRTQTITPTYGGSYNVHDSYGRRTQTITPTYGGGYNVYDSYGRRQFTID